MSIRFIAIVAALAAALFLSACDVTQFGTAKAASKAETGGAAETPAEGPHGGRLLKDGDFSVEVTIFEDNVPPEFRIYAYQGGEPVDLKQVDLEVELERLGGRVDRFDFKPKNDYLLGDGVVTEPHSFEVMVAAEYEGNTYRWEYSSYEGRVSIGAEAAKRAGITTTLAGPGTIRETVKLYGNIVPDPSRVRRVGARFPGVVVAVDKAVGDTVAKGERLASVEANDSLRRYAVTSPIAGVVTERRVEPGEMAGTEPLLTVADYDEVWAELQVFPGHAQRVQVGQPVVVGASDDPQAKTTVSYRAPRAAGNGQSTVARAVLANRQGHWTPGHFVQATVEITEREVPIAVERRALQTFRDWDVVFIKVGEAYQVRPLELGAGDGEYVEVISGLKPDERYVVDNSYLIKADIEKFGAVHGH